MRLAFTINTIVKTMKTHHLIDNRIIDIFERITPDFGAWTRGNYSFSLKQEKRSNSHLD